MLPPFVLCSEFSWLSSRSNSIENRCFQMERAVPKVLYIAAVLVLGVLTLAEALPACQGALPLGGSHIYQLGSLRCDLRPPRGASVLPRMSKDLPEIAPQEARRTDQQVKNDL